MTKYLMGIDPGTSGVKCIIIDETGKVIKSSTKTYPLYTPKPAWSEQNPEDWWNGTKEAVKEVLSDFDASLICGIGFSGQMHGLVALDKDDNIIRPAILWNDQRTEAECKEIIETAGGIDGLVSYTNNNMLPGFTGGKLLWVKKNEPENYDKIVKFFMPKDYIRFRLTGAKATDVSDASGTGLFDVEKRCWAYDLIDKLGFDRSIFPEVFESDEVTSYISEETEKELGLKAGTRVYGGGGDAVIQNAGMGIVKEGTLGVVMGTSGVVATPLSTFGVNEGGKLQFFCNNSADKWMAFGCQLSCAGSMEWFKNTFYGDLEKPFVAINKEAEESSVGAGGVQFLPYLTGERCPYSDPAARGVFYGMSLLTKRGDFGRAVMEGVVFGLKQIVDLIKKSNPDLEFKEVILSGGAIHSTLWKQIVADIMGITVKTLKGAAEGGAYGGAIVAGVGEKIWERLDDVDVLEVDEIIEPIPENVEKYKEVMKVYEKLYFDLKETFDMCAAEQ
ncbi:MAG: xylulokinase [Christensenellaceae bacterium]|nr:xylulokinase [Christensenellaceae bacterium]